MKKDKASVRSKLRATYRRADFPRGLVRGKYASRVAVQPTVVQLDPEVAAAFPTSEAVNRALTKVMRAAKASRRGDRGARGAASPATTPARKRGPGALEAVKRAP